MWRSFALLQSSSTSFGNLKAACPSMMVNAWTLSIPNRGKIIFTPAHVAVWQNENRFESSPFLNDLTQRYSLEWKVAAEYISATKDNKETRVNESDLSGEDTKLALQQKEGTIRG